MSGGAGDFVEGANTIDQLKRFTQDSILRRNAYWEMHYRFSKYNNMLSIPLLLFSSLTGITSVSQVSSAEANPAATWATAVLGTASTFLAATQRFFRYGERAEQCKSLAKGYGDLARRIEITLDMYQDGAKPEWGLEELGKFAEEIVQEMRKLMTETQDMPTHMLQKETSFEQGPGAVVVQIPGPTHGAQPAARSGGGMTLVVGGAASSSPDDDAGSSSVAQTSEAPK